MFSFFSSPELTTEQKSLRAFLDALNAVKNTLSTPNLDISGAPALSRVLRVLQDYLSSDIYAFDEMKTVEEFIDNLHRLPKAKLAKLLMMHGSFFNDEQSMRALREEFQRPAVYTELYNKQVLLELLSQLIYLHNTLKSSDALVFLAAVTTKRMLLEIESTRKPIFAFAEMNSFGDMISSAATLNPIPANVTRYLREHGDIIADVRLAIEIVVVLQVMVVCWAKLFFEVKPPIDDNEMRVGGFSQRMEQCVNTIQEMTKDVDLLDILSHVATNKTFIKRLEVIASDAEFANRHEYGMILRNINYIPVIIKLLKPSDSSAIMMFNEENSNAFSTVLSKMLGFQITADQIKHLNSPVKILSTISIHFVIVARIIEERLVIPFEKEHDLQKKLDLFKKFQENYNQDFSKNCAPCIVNNQFIKSMLANELLYFVEKLVHESLKEFKLKMSEISYKNADEKVAYYMSVVSNIAEFKNELYDIIKHFEITYEKLDKLYDKVIDQYILRSNLIKNEVAEFVCKELGEVLAIRKTVGDLNSMVNEKIHSAMLRVYGEYRDNKYKDEKFKTEKKGILSLVREKMRDAIYSIAQSDNPEPRVSEMKARFSEIDKVLEFNLSDLFNDRLKTKLTMLCEKLAKSFRYKFSHHRSDNDNLIRWFLSEKSHIMRIANALGIADREAQQEINKHLDRELIEKIAVFVSDFPKDSHRDGRIDAIQACSGWGALLSLSQSDIQTRFDDPTRRNVTDGIGVLCEKMLKNEVVSFVKAYLLKAIEDSCEEKYEDICKAFMDSREELMRETYLYSMADIDKIDHGQVDSKVGEQIKEVVPEITRLFLKNELFKFNVGLGILSKLLEIESDNAKFSQIRSEILKEMLKVEYEHYRQSKESLISGLKLLRCDTTRIDAHIKDQFRILFLNYIDMKINSNLTQPLLKAESENEARKVCDDFEKNKKRMYADFELRSTIIGNDAQYTYEMIKDAMTVCFSRTMPPLAYKAQKDCLNDEGLSKGKSLLYRFNASHAYSSSSATVSAKPSSSF